MHATSRLHNWVVEEDVLPDLNTDSDVPLEPHTTEHEEHVHKD
jgi:hypothetical protein